MIGRRHALAATLWLAALAPASAAAPAADSLGGLWVAALHFGPAVRGELRVDRLGDSGRATIAGHTVTFDVASDSVFFVIEPALGAYRGKWTKDRRAIEGFWIQPPGDPVGSEQPYAAPLRLEAAGKQAWHGVVRPLDDQFTLYLKIDRTADGGAIAAFRNPEYNSRGRASQFRVEIDGDSLRFRARPDTTRPEIRLDGVRVRLQGPPRIRLFWPDLDRTVELVRPDERQAAAFLPRAPRDTAYVYRRPPATSDGWVTARAAEVGLDEAKLASVVHRLGIADPAARLPTLMHSMLIARHGKLVLEEYFFGFDRDRPHDLRSAGKTFASVLLGAALRDGVAITPETPVYELLAARGPFANPDPRKSRITVAHLMTHTSGLACDDNSGDSPGDELTTQLQKQQPDWWKYTLDLPIAYDPGTHYAYCSMGMNLVSAALTTASRTWLPALFERLIARPLQFGPYYWNLIPGTREGYLGGGSYLRPRDLLKVGQVFLEGGTWHGRRLVEASWVSRSTAPQTEVSMATTGLDSLSFIQSYGTGWDAYAWHPRVMHIGGHEVREYEANGNGGQLLIVLPDYDMTIVFTAGLYGQGFIWQRFRNQIVAEEILPAIR